MSRRMMMMWRSLLPSIEESQFYAEKEDNDEGRAVDVDVSNTCGDSVTKLQIPIGILEKL